LERLSLNGEIKAIPFEIEVEIESGKAVIVLLGRRA